MPNLVELAATAASCLACPELVCSRTSVVVGTRPPGARLALVGEAPGAQEDTAGDAVRRQEWAALDRLLAEAGLTAPASRGRKRPQCRPPGNRGPRAVEVGGAVPGWTRQSSPWSARSWWSPSG